MSEYFNTPAPAVLKARIPRFAALVALATLTGCADKGPTCSDESTVSVVKAMYQEAMGTILVAAPDAAAARTQIAAGTSVEVRSIRTVGKDEKIGLMSCEASLSVKVPADIATAIATPGHVLNVATQSLALTVNVDRLEGAIQYTSQMTDDGKEIRVKAKGVQEMGQLIALLGARGAFESKVPVVTPAATVAAASVAALAAPETKAVSAAAPAAEVPPPSFVAGTKLGSITITDDRQLLWLGKPLTPAMQANSKGVSMWDKFEIGDGLALLMKDAGDTACPTKFVFIKVTANSAARTEYFGTCSDRVEAIQHGNRIVVTMPGFRGPNESSTEQSKAAGEKHTFAYEGSVVTELAGASAASATVEPSFSCGGKLTSAEKLICETPSLAQADAQLAKRYNAAQTRVADVVALKQEQRSWRQTRDSCADVACMEASYAKRLAELQR